jgi:hypothetical protein
LKDPDEILISYPEWSLESQKVVKNGNRLTFIQEMRVKDETYVFLGQACLQEQKILTYVLLDQKDLSICVDPMTSIIYLIEGNILFVLSQKEINRAQKHGD